MPALTPQHQEPHPRIAGERCEPLAKWKQLLKAEKRLYWS
jgi:hypothetical protein